MIYFIICVVYLLLLLFTANLYVILHNAVGKRNSQSQTHTHGIGCSFSWLHRRIRNNEQIMFSNQFIVPESKQSYLIISYTFSRQKTRVFLVYKTLEPLACCILFACAQFHPFATSIIENRGFIIWLALIHTFTHFTRCFHRIENFHYAKRHH